MKYIVTTTDGTGHQIDGSLDKWEPWLIFLNDENELVGLFNPVHVISILRR